MITLSILGQGYYGGENQRNDVINIDVDLERGIINDDFYYGFETKDGAKYVLAYRKGQGTFDTDELTADNNYRHTKDLVLHRWINNDWIEASNVVQTDHRFKSTYINKYGIECITTNNMSYIIFKGLSDGFVDIQSKGNVIMKITNMRTTTNENGNSRELYYNLIVFQPNGDGTYKATQK